MPNVPESSQPIQGIDATPATSVPEIKGAPNQVEYNWKRFWPQDLYRTKFSDEPEIYKVHIDGSVPCGNLELTRNDVSAEIVNDEIHPALAIGHAVIEFMSKYPRAHIHEFTAYKRVVKRSRTTKKK